jgi:hypothetical protein
MGYYMRGDYYQRGDYYRGDFFGGLVGGIAGAVKGFATGGLTGLVTGAISGANTGSRGAPPPPGAPLQLGPLGKIPLAPFPGAPTASGIVSAATAGAAGAAGVPRGYHISKRTGRIVKNRHMNVANPRALSRAARRAHGFLRMSKRFVRYYTPKAHKGHAYIGRKRRSSR